MELRTRRLGSGGPKITVVGTGSFALGGAGWLFTWGPQDDTDSKAALQRAVERGVNWIDTAPVYGHGHAEEVVRDALAGMSLAQRPFIFTKCGRVWSNDEPFADPMIDLRPATIRRECEDSLRRLGVDRLDMLQFHWPDRSTGAAIEESWGELSRLVHEGKVGWAGVSNFDVPLLERCERIMHVDSLQPPFSAIRREAAAEIVPWCAANGTGVIVYGPMRAGLLTDTFSTERIERMDAKDWRRRNEDFTPPAFERNLALRDALVPIATRLGTTVAAVAVAWTIAWPGVTAAVVGARSARQVDGWVEAGTLELGEDHLEEIARAIETTGAGAGPERPAAALATKK
jgi:aryl-alcohol dehydrogenase-like predicted oxidoreductase